MSWPIGTTARSTHGRGPLEHALTGQYRTRTGRTRRALCGAGVYPAGVYPPDPMFPNPDFDPASDRACPRCARKVKEMRAL